ncbi:MAG: RNA polymerase-binding protein DksA [Gammaproteobacteria bacterium]
MDLELASDYRPSADEPYMNSNQLAYFSRKLLAWREALAQESRQSMAHLRTDAFEVGDFGEWANREAENSLELRVQDRARKLMAKIDAALRRIEDGTYGYCQETGEKIGLERLEARPIATLSVEAQARWERQERQLATSR